MSDLINGLRHMADDHPCCRETLQLTIDTIEVLERENAALRSLLREAITDYVSPYDLPEGADYIERAKAALGEAKP